VYRSSLDASRATCPLRSRGPLFPHIPSHSGHLPALSSPDSPLSEDALAHCRHGSVSPRGWRKSIGEWLARTLCQGQQAQHAAGGNPSAPRLTAQAIQGLIMARRLRGVRYRGNLPGPLRLHRFRQAGGKFDYHPILAVTYSSRFVTTSVIPGRWRLATVLRTCPGNDEIRPHLGPRPGGNSTTAVSQHAFTSRPKGLFRNLSAGSDQEADRH
jgi:hypothetical protein